MTKHSKRRRLSISSRNTTPEPTSVPSNNLNETHSIDNQDPSDGSSLSNSGIVLDMHKHFNGDSKQIRRYASEMALHDRSIVELRPDGTILITPRPLPEPPSQVISSILDHLSDHPPTLHQCTLVTKRFNTIATPLLWRNLDFLDDDSLDPKLMDMMFGVRYGIKTDRFIASIKDLSAERLNTLAHYIHKLQLLGSHWTDHYFTCLLPHIPHLKLLTIYKNMNITDASFQHLPHYCQKLTSLKLIRTQLTQISFSAIGEECHQLDSFQWYILDGQSPEWLAWLVRCPLEHLRIWSKTTLWSKTTQLILKSWKHLTSLEISILNVPVYLKSLLLLTTGTTNHHNHLTYNNNNNNNSDGDDENDNDNTTMTLTSKPWVPQLTILNLRPCADIDDATMIAFIESHTHLQQITLRDPTQLTNATLKAMALLLKDLTHVNWTGNSTQLTPKGIQRFVRNGPPNLVSVKLEFCHWVNIHSIPESTVGNHKMDLDQEAIEKIRSATMDENIGIGCDTTV